MNQIPQNVKQLQEKLRKCDLCPRHCAIDRTAGQLGACRIGHLAKIASAMPHFGEEPVLVGNGGSGTIFFSGCNLDCLFCQNFDISHSSPGQELQPEEIAELALQLARKGCENINFVTPTHVSHAVAEAIVISRSRGLSIPTVYNCGGYESVQTLRLLESLIDIYMPDFKYADAVAAQQYSGVPDYPNIATLALEEMYRQVGPLQCTSDGIATRGLLVRHLVMPNDIAGSKKVIDIVARTAPCSAINIMAQYRPAYRAWEFPELTSHPSSETIRSLRQYATHSGLQNI